MITLQNKNVKLNINPELGASLQSFTYQGQDILRPATANTIQPQEQSLFVMVPYCSYIKGGHFNYFGISRKISSQNEASEDPLHGDGWQTKWQVVTQEPTKATLSYTHNKEKGFPFDYKATVSYELTEDGLKINLSVYNPSELPMPCGLGVHPYFLHPDQAQISFNSSHIWYHKTDPIFDRPYPTPKQWDFSKPREIIEDFDTAFGGWDGKATIIYPEQQIEIDITAEDIFHHLTLFHPLSADFFCLEPVSNTPDAFNLAAYGVIGTGIQSVGKHQTLSKTITFSCQHL